MFKALNIQREFGPDAVAAKGVKGHELAMRMLFELSQGRSKPGPAGPVKGHSRPGAGPGDKALQELQGTCQPSSPGGTGLKEALALVFTAFKGRTVKSWPPNAHIMWEKVLGRK